VTRVTRAAGVAQLGAERPVGPRTDFRIRTVAREPSSPGVSRDASKTSLGRLSSVSSTLLQPPQASPATVPDCSPRLRSQTSFPDPRATLQGAAQRGVRYRSVAEAEIRMGPELHTLGVGERLAVGEIIVVLETRKDSKLGLLQVRFDRGWAR
jgi:hypothetical protein